MDPICHFKTALRVPRGFTDPEWAVELLKTYYRPRLQGEGGESPWHRPNENRGYVGACFDRWHREPREDPGATRFTLEDILAVQMLSVSVPSWVVVDLVGRRKDFFS